MHLLFFVLGSGGGTNDGHDGGASASANQWPNG
jgi:hypothetical protein